MKLRLARVLPFGWFCAAQTVFGSGFAITEMSARAQGMAGAFTSIADDGSALFFNPAGMAFQQRTTMQMEALAIVGLFRFHPSNAPAGQAVPEKGYAGLVRPHFISCASMFLVTPLSPKVTFGFGAFIPFGLASNYTNFNDADPALTKFPARFAGTRGRLESIWFQPTVAYRVSRNSAISVGVALVHTHIFLERSFLNPLDDGRQLLLLLGATPDIRRAVGNNPIFLILPEGRLRTAGTSNAPGFNAGYLYNNETRKFSFGASWRSPVVHHLEGKAAFSFVPGNFPLPFPLSAFFPNQNIKGEFTTPGTYAFGVSTSRWANTLLAFDFNILQFSRFQDVVINFTQTQGTALTPERRLPFHFSNSYTAKFGVERTLKANTIRAGYSRDSSPVPDASVGPFFPDSTRNNLTFGASHRRGSAEFTFFYQAMFLSSRTTNVAANAVQFTNGRQDNFAHLAGLGLRVHVGKPRD